MQKQVIKFTNRSPYPNSIFIGNEDDNLARRVQFVLPSEIDGAKIYLHLSIGEYSDVIELDDSLIYVPTRTHTQYPGNWTGYLEAHAGNDTVWHSNTFTFKVGDLPDSGEQIEQTYPSAIEEALRAVDMLTGVGARAVTLEPGSDATVSFEEDAEGKRTIVYGIPRGADGSCGAADRPIPARPAGSRPPPPPACGRRSARATTARWPTLSPTTAIWRLSLASITYRIM